MAEVQVVPELYVRQVKPMRVIAQLPFITGILLLPRVWGVEQLDIEDLREVLQRQALATSLELRPRAPGGACELS